MIPRLLHHIWLGPRPVPEDWAAKWADLHPGWTVKVWREADLAALPMRNRTMYDQMVADSYWVGAADVARLEILYELGGVYTDIDSAPVRTLEGAWFLNAEVVAAYEPIQEALPGRVANGTIAAVPHHDAIDEARGLISRMKVTEPPWATIGAPALTAALLVHEQCCDIRILPSKVFFRKDARGRPVAGQEESYVEHFWATTTHAYPVQTVVLVPRRAGDKTRDAIWEWCKAIWGQQGWPIFEGHYDEPGLFNASAARNRAAAAAGAWDVAIFSDADTLPWDWKPIHEGVRLAAATGRFIRPFTTYHMLDEAATRSFMDTGQLPKDGSRKLRESAYGGIHIVPRRLWDATGGYDERFLGWGSEDAAFQFAGRAMGGYRQIRGDVYHLYHPMQPRDPSTPQFKANVALGARYRAVQMKPEKMLDILTEPGAPLAGKPRRLPPRRNDGVPDGRVIEVKRAEPTFGLVIMTNGRKDLLEKTVASIEERISPEFAARLICDDSGEAGYADWLRGRFPGFEIDAHRHMGHGPAVQRALSKAAGLPVDWVFFSEDDIEYGRDVDLRELARVMDANPKLTQLVLKRQAWFPAEVEAGPTVIDRFDPALFVERADNGSSWLEHRQFYSLNPHLVRTKFLRLNRWPPVPNSEHQFTRRLFRDRTALAGLWGKRTDEPWITHVGGERTGTGY